jgi:HAD superfamily hydrolase (TIGR01490 family)
MELVLFDLDGTLIQTDSDHAFGDFLIQERWVDGAEFKARNDAFYDDYLAGKLDLPAYVAFSTSAWRTRPAAEAMAVRERFMQQVMRPAITPKALELVQSHQRRGHLVAIVTATNEFVTTPIAQALGVEHLIALQLVPQSDGEGLYTGAIKGIPTFREGKIQRVEHWLEGMGRQRSDFAAVHCYSDSINDLPLLEWATHPVATNPGQTLEAVAQQRAWPILRLFE